MTGNGTGILKADRYIKEIYHKRKQINVFDLLKECLLFLRQ